MRRSLARLSVRRDLCSYVLSKERLRRHELDARTTNVENGCMLVRIIVCCAALVSTPLLGEP